MVNLGNDWDEILKDEFQKDYYRNLRKFLADEYRKCVVYPNMYDIFNALRYTSFENTRAVILGQDPYHGPHQAHGLCFSVLNSVLTVREHQPNSHKGMGWEIFTDRVISELNKKTEPVVFLLWGANARQKAKVITNPIHVKLETVHPSPLSAYNGFFGCKHFSKCNQILADSGQRTIEWQLSD